MIKVNENLLLAESEWSENNNNNGFNHIKFTIDQGDLISGKNYIVKGIIKQTGPSSGKFSIGIGDEKDIGWYIEPNDILNAGSFSFKFTYLPNRMKYIYFYTDVWKKTNGIGAVFSNLSLYEENRVSDVFLPNVNKLSTSNKPLLPPEGNYKEIQPM